MLQAKTQGTLNKDLGNGGPLLQSFTKPREKVNYLVGWQGDR